MLRFVRRAIPAASRGRVILARDRSGGQSRPRPLAVRPVDKLAPPNYPSVSLKYYELTWSAPVLPIDLNTYRDFLETAPDAMVVADDDGVIRLVNEQMRKLLDYAPDELVGQPIEVLLPEHADHGAFARQDAKRRLSRSRAGARRPEGEDSDGDQPGVGYGGAYGNDRHDDPRRL